MIAAAHDLLALGPRAVLLKGGHMEGDELVDVLLERGGVAEEFVTRRIHTRHTHGTGCTLASAIATGLGQACRCAMRWYGRAPMCMKRLRERPVMVRGPGHWTIRPECRCGDLNS